MCGLGAYFYPAIFLKLAPKFFNPLRLAFPTNASGTVGSREWGMLEINGRTAFEFYS